MSSQEIIVLILGLFASAAIILSALSVRRRRLIAFALVNSFIAALEYLIVGSFTGLAICLIGAFRNITLLGASKWEWLDSKLVLGGFLVAHTTAFVIFANWGNLAWFDFLPLIGALLGTAAFMSKDMAKVKATLIVTVVFWLGYEYQMGLYGQMVGDSLNLIANFYALTILMRERRKGIPESEVGTFEDEILDNLTGSIPVITGKIQQVLTGSIPVVTSSTHIVSTKTKPLPVVTNTKRNKSTGPNTRSTPVVTGK